MNQKVLSRYRKVADAISLGSEDLPGSERPSKIGRTLLFEDQGKSSPAYKVDHSNSKPDSEVMGLNSPIICSTPRHSDKRSTKHSRFPYNDQCESKVEPSVVISVDCASGMKKKSLASDLIPLGKSLIKGTYRQIAVAAWKSPGVGYPRVFC